MNTAKILGHAHGTSKHESFQGQRLAIAQPLGVRDKHDGPPLLVLDTIGSRIGDRVMLTSDGSHVREITGNDSCPARWCVCGIIDESKPN